MSDTQTIEAFMGHQRRRGLAPESIRHRAYTLRGLARWRAPGSILEVTDADIDNWLDSRGLKPRSRNWHLINLSCFYKWCLTQGLVDHDPTSSIVRPRSPRLLPRPIGAEQLQLALEHADARMRCWLLLASYCGLRVKEIAGLERHHILDTADPPAVMIESGKGGHQRIVPLHAAVLEALELFGLPVVGPLWVGRQGRLQARTIGRFVASFLRGLKIDATAHRGRHFFATQVYRLSHDLLMTQNLLGHASPATTAIYAAWDQVAAAGVIANIGAGLVR